MRKKTIAIILITTVSLIELQFIKPIIPAFYGMTMMQKAVYVILLFGFPVWVVIPIALVTVPLAYLFKRDKKFKTNWSNYIQNIFFVFSVLILLINSILVLSKYGMGNDPFPLLKYAEVKGFEGDLSDLRTGEFESIFGVIKRFEDKQIETYPDNESAEFSIEWISNNEYRLVLQQASKEVMDTLDVKITNNAEGFYECYVRFGQYADYQKIIKK